MPRRLAADDPHCTAGTAQCFGKELHECFVGRGIDGRGGDFHLQLAAQDLADSIFGGAALIAK
jgi:hypothetical protein